MIEILVYLFETYGYADACPEEPEQLARKLAAVGFESQDIEDAVEWLGDLRLAAGAPAPTTPAAPGAFRVFSEFEIHRLDTASRGFLTFLEAAGVLDPRRRELAIDRALALAEDEITLSQFKVIVLMVLWQERASVDALILDELLTDELSDLEAEGLELVRTH